MPRPTLTDKIPGLHAQLDNLWDTEREDAEKNGRIPRAVKVWRAIHGNVSRDPAQGKKPSRSYVEDYLSRAKSPKGDKSLLPTYIPWVAWENPKETPDQRAFLLRLNMVPQIGIGQPLSQQDVKWACRLQPALHGLHPYGQYALINLYAVREILSLYYGRKPTYTADLDAIVVFQAWRPERWLIYLQAIEIGTIPLPNLGGGKLGVGRMPIINDPPRTDEDTATLEFLPAGAADILNRYSDLLRQLRHFFSPPPSRALDDHSKAERDRNDLLIHWATLT